MSRMTDFMRSTNDAAKSLSKEDAEPVNDIENPNVGSEQNKEIKKVRTSAVTTNEQRESQEPMIADNTDDIGKN